jgi:hypothetical protein
MVAVVVEARVGVGAGVVVFDSKAAIGSVVV